MHCSNLFAHEGQAKLAQKLVEISGLGGKAFFCNSGGEANEGMIKFARKYGNAHGVIVCMPTGGAAFHFTLPLEEDQNNDQ